MLLASSRPCLHRWSTHERSRIKRHAQRPFPKARISMRQTMEQNAILYTRNMYQGSADLANEDRKKSTWTDIFERGPYWWYQHVVMVSKLLVLGRTMEQGMTPEMAGFESQPNAFCRCDRGWLLFSEKGLDLYTHSPMWPSWYFSPLPTMFL